MDEDAILNKNSGHSTSYHDSFNFSLSSIDYLHSPNNNNNHNTTMTPTRHETESSSSSDNGEGEIVHRKRKSIRKSLTNAFVSPARAAKDKLSAIPRTPKKQGPMKKKRSTTNWQKRLNLPPGVTEDEAIAVLLAKELTMLDF
jgi:hypothetical protein